MKPFALISAAFLAFAPAAALARECNKEMANVCQDGYVWDHEAGACVEIVSG